MTAVGNVFKNALLWIFLELCLKPRPWWMFLKPVVTSGVALGESPGW